MIFNRSSNFNDIQTVYELNFQTMNHVQLYPADSFNINSMLNWQMTLQFRHWKKIDIRKNISKFDVQSMFFIGRQRNMKKSK